MIAPSAIAPVTAEGTPSLIAGSINIVVPSIAPTAVIGSPAIIVYDPFLPQPAFNVDDTVISQYANSPAIVALVETWETAIDPSVKLRAFYDLIWNVDTAEQYGLDVWGRIVGIARVLKVPVGKFFGFDEATTVSADPFDQSPFYNGQTLTENFSLADNAFRLLILAKAAANISDGSIASINAILTALFPGRGNAYVTDGRDKTMTYTFAFDPPLSPVEQAIVASGVLPKTAGVTSSVVIA